MELVSMKIFLLYERGRVALQLRLIDTRQIMLNAVDEELLATRKRQRQGVEESGLKGTATVPIAA
mgnify:CR=1 FL=1